VEGGNYTVTVRANENIGPQTLSYSGKTVGITIIGNTTEWLVILNANGSLFTVESGVTLTLDNNIALQGRSGNTASLVRVNSGGTLVMNSGSKVMGNTSSSSGGGGVYVNSGAFTMSGGTISGNTSYSSYYSYGGGVYVYGGTFTMSGGTISGNTSSSYSYSYSYGGGVYVGAYGLFIKQSGGTIYGSNGGTLKNTASIGDSYGHAVYVSSSPTKKRNTTAGTGVTLNSGVSGSSGGWE
jgi:hypothetical protein